MTNPLDSLSLSNYRRAQRQSEGTTMRIRAHIPLPGPFTLTSGGRRSGGSGLGVLCFVGLFYLGAWFAWTIGMLIVHGIAVGFALMVLVIRRVQNGLQR